MKPDSRSSARGGADRLTRLVAGATLVIAIGWCFLMLIATAIGSKAPTASEMLSLVWPALAGSVPAILALMFLSRRMPVVPILLAITGLVTAIAGIKFIIS